jgi:type IV pilus assembly protein PilC
VQRQPRDTSARALSDHKNTMSSFAYVAVDHAGAELRGTLDASDQSEALRRIKEMGLFPARVSAREKEKQRRPAPRGSSKTGTLHKYLILCSFGRAVKPRILTTLTRQLATLIEAGMPLLRSLRLLQEQSENRLMKEVVGDLAFRIESGDSFTEAVRAHPKIFTPLYVNMVRAGEIGGALDITLKRLAEFMEKNQRIKAKVKAALFYPFAVLGVAGAILILLMVYVVPRFREVFSGLLPGAKMPPFSAFVFSISEVIKNHALPVAIVLGVFAGCVTLSLRTKWGRWFFDKFKLSMPVLGSLFRKTAIARFARTLGTLVTNGVPILQALTIVKETAGNVVVGGVISDVHENVKAGDPIAPTLKASGVFPLIIAGMVDVGEQTGALPEMLMKIADGCDEDVDNATTALTSLLEPILIVFLAVIVGSIVIAMFLPIKVIMDVGFDDPAGRSE